MQLGKPQWRENLVAMTRRRPKGRTVPRTYALYFILLNEAKPIILRAWRSESSRVNSYCERSDS
jgi:hypothetical protein